MKKQHRSSLALAAALAVVVLTATAALAADTRTPSRFNANLTDRAEVPAPKDVPHLSGGNFSSKLDGNVLSWTLKFHNLTGSATAAHIHIGAKGKAGPVAVPLCGPCKSPMSGKSTLSASVIAAMSKGNAYVNVHTVKNAAGEIRGQL